jgi:WD40 repeat protein
LNTINDAVFSIGG